VGDFFLLAPGREFTLRNEKSSDVLEFDDDMRERLRRSIPLGGAGDSTTLICGKFAFGDTHASTLTDLLPPVIHVPANEARTSGFAKTIDLLADETVAESPASKLVTNRLADILFIQAIRAHVASPGRDRTPWLHALADQQIGTSLRSMHETLEKSWTVAMLASDVGMSRSSYAQRFKELLGEGPLEYLTRWRMNRAKELLVETGNKLVDVAQAVGYDSDSSFQRVFKRVYGASPGEYRRRHTLRGPASHAAAESGSTARRWATPSLTARSAAGGARR
jgi:AraC-like DNA-binding protein